MRFAVTRMYQPGIAVKHLIFLALGASVISGLAPHSSVAADEPAKTAATETKAPEPVTGRVLSPTGAPLAGATVSLVVRNDVRKAESMVTASAKTDAAGAFRFERPAAPGPGIRMVSVMAEAAGFGLWMTDSWQPDQPLEIRLRAAAQARLRFEDEAGKPIEGARIRAHMLLESSSENVWTVLNLPTEGRDDLFSRRTDASGNCSFEGLPLDMELRFRVDDDRFAQPGVNAARIPLSHTATTVAQLIRLQPAAAAAGRITLPDGKPVAGVRISAQDPRNGIFADARSDKDGRYTLKQLAPGAYTLSLTLEKEMATDWAPAAARQLPVGKGATISDIDFSLTKGAVVSGHVMAEQGGAPVPGFYVGIRANNDSGWSSGGQSAVTGPDGSFRLRVPAGSQELYINSRAPSGFSMPAVRNHRFTIEEGATKVIDFKLPPGPVLKPVKVTVLGPDGAAVEGADIERSQKGSRDYMGAMSGGRTGADGKVEIDDLGAPMTFRARKGNLATAEVTTASGGEAITLTLAENVMASVRGRVVDSEGKPVAGARISRTRWSGEYGSGGEAGVSDEEGRFEASGMWPDAGYTFTASATGYGYNGEPDRIKLTPGETRDLEPIVLLKADAFLAGRVVDSDGRALAGVTVNGNRGRVTTTTDSEGRFRLENLIRGKQNISVYTNNTWADKNVQTGNENVLLIMSAPRATPGD